MHFALNRVTIEGSQQHSPNQTSFTSFLPEKSLPLYIAITQQNWPHRFFYHVKKGHSGMFGQFLVVSGVLFFLLEIFFSILAFWRVWAVFSEHLFSLSVTWSWGLSLQQFHPLPSLFPLTCSVWRVPASFPWTWGFMTGSPGFASHGRGLPPSTACSSRARWPLVPNFCSRVTGKS